MIKAVKIGDNGKGLTTIHIDCDLAQTGIESIDVVCEPGKAQQAQDFVLKIMQIMSLPDKVTRAAGGIGQLFGSKAKI
jgi:hypothetical protein